MRCTVSNGTVRSNSLRPDSNSWMRPPENNIIGTLPSCNDMPTGFAVWYMRPVAIVIRMPLSCNRCRTSLVYSDTVLSLRNKVSSQSMATI